MPSSLRQLRWLLSAVSAIWLICWPIAVWAQPPANDSSVIEEDNQGAPWTVDDMFPVPENTLGPSMPGERRQPVFVSYSDAPQVEGILTSAMTQPNLVGPSRSYVRPSIPQPAAAVARSQSVFGAERFSQSLIARELYARRLTPGTDIVSGAEAAPRVTTDSGNLVGKSPKGVNTSIQRRTRVVSEPRVRGSRIGQTSASGSYWIPARIDLDTAMSKIDSRLIRDITLIGGPYSVDYGPGLDFIDIEMLQSPRYEDGFECHGSTGFDFNANGEQWNGLQQLTAGNTDWGLRASYGHRTGNDFQAGNGDDVAASYNSRDLYVTFGKDLPDSRSVEVSFLRLDQTGIEFPGYVFDMDYLVTDAVEIAYVVEDRPLFDRLTVDTWFNNTRFAGNAQNPSKRDEFPILDFFNYVGFTDAATMSTGYTAATTWGLDGDPQLTFGTDLRFVTQYINEIGSGRIGFLLIDDSNSPLPESESVNPGIFARTAFPMSDDWTLSGGVRVDWTHTNVTEDPANLDSLGFRPAFLQSSLADILGTDEFDQNFLTWGAYLTSRYELNDTWALLAGAGHSQRPPSLTELYVAETFLLLLQNGLNTATGDPRLAPEKKWQVDLGMACTTERFSGRANAFCAWVNDYITFENMDVIYGPPAGQVEQEQLKYVNTDWALLTGFELQGEYQANDWLSPFGTLRYVEGRDLTRNGDFATTQAVGKTPSTRVYGLPRGFFSGIAGGAEEPLPGIVPLESRLGLRVHQAAATPRWGTELAVRVVDGQYRIATSLLELPTPGFAVWDFRSYWRPNDTWLLVAGVENFGNRTYREHLDFRNQSGIGVYQPGVSFYFGSELTY